MPRKASAKVDSPAPPVKPEADEQGGVFISHVHEDEPLAEAFELLVQNVSAGVVPTHRSTAKQSGGIPYGQEWFSWICERVDRASCIVALLTPSSIARPWILFEAGLGKAKPDKAVFGVCLGVSREDAYTGPFGVLQNCGTDDKELSKLCRQLIEGSLANPNDDMVNQCVATFRSAVETHFAKHKPGHKRDEDQTSTAVFQALEEMKLMIRDQSRMFEMEPSRRSRHPRNQERFLMAMEMAGETPNPELGLWLTSALAMQLGYFWVEPLVQYVARARRGQHPDPESLLQPFREFVRASRPETPYEDHLFHIIERAFRRYAEYRCEEKASAADMGDFDLVAFADEINRRRSVGPGKKPGNGPK